MKRKQNYSKMVAACSLVILLIMAAFFVFTKENRRRITAQNMEYIKDSTVQIANRADEVLLEGYDNIRILSAFLSHSLDSPDVDVEQIRELAGNSVFDFIEFADKDGMDHNITGGVSDARDRQYYLDGMKGNVGMEVIFNSRATHETLLMFYSPIIFENEPAGVLIGVFQASNRLTRLLQADYFGEQANLYLCTPEGRLVASNLPLDPSAELSIADLAEGDESLADRMNAALKTGQSITFSLGEKGASGCMAKLPENGWFLVQVFPKSANDIMVWNTNFTGILLEIFLLTLFGSILAALVLVFRKERRIIEDVAEERGKYKNAVLADAIIVFEANLTKNIIQEGAWKGEDGKPVPLQKVLGLSLPCSYDTYINRWAERYVDEGSRQIFLENAGRENMIQAFLDGKSEITFDYDARSLEDRAIFARRSVYLTQDQKTGDVIAYSNVKDMTEQRFRESQRQQYEQMLLTTASGIYRGVRQVDMSDFSMVYLSFENNRILTQEKGDWHTWLQGQVSNVHPDDWEHVKEQLGAETLERMPVGGSLRCDFRSAEKNEKGFYRVYSTSAFKMERGGKIYVNMVTMDNTMAVENEMRQKALIEDALLKAENASKAKTVFLSNMSHDMRTPMNAIIGFTTLAIRHIDKREQVLDYLGKIASSSSHLLSLINDVLDMNRIESGRIHLEEDECSLLGVLDELKNILASDVNAKRLNFSVDTTGLRDEHAICDRLRVKQVLLNLLGNSVKFTEAGGDVSVRLTEKPDERKGWAVYEFRVKDTGIGISEEFLKHIFEPFERERSSTVSGIQGTGLGMAITKNLVDLMGGTISVASKKGQGTEFVVGLPMKKAPGGVESTEGGQSAGESGSARGGQSAGESTGAAGESQTNGDGQDAGAAESGSCRATLAGKRALLVEDNDLNREIARELLSEEGMIIEEAEDGKIAVDRLLEKGAGYYDLVLMDIQMPVMDGYEATRTIRRFADKDLASIPIVAMTANAFEEDQKRVIEMEMDAYIAKPVDVEKMLDTLGRLF